MEHPRSSVPEFIEEQREHLGRGFATDRKRENFDPQDALHIDTIVAQDASADPVLTQLEGALRKCKLNMVCNMTTELIDVLGESRFEQEVIDCCLRTHVPRLFEFF